VGDLKMTEYHNALLMVDLILGTNNRTAFKRDLHHEDYELLYSDMRHCAEIADRLRMQTLHIVQALRTLQKRHASLRHPVKKKYSAYENMLCRQDLRQHWILYRQAVQDFHEARKRCHRKIGTLSANDPGKDTKSGSRAA